MTTTLALRQQDIRDFRVGDSRVLLHIPSTSLFAADGIVSDLLDLFQEDGAVTQDQLRQRFDGRYPAADVVETLQELIALRIVGDGSAPAPTAPIEVGDLPVNTVILNVNTGCNLACSYCYKEDLATPAHGNRMDFATAARAVDLTFEAAAERPFVNVVFFGGEPLTNVPLIRQVVDHAESRARETGKRIDFSLTTNATLLSDELIDYFQAHRFGLTISMDGPIDIHDRHRRTIGGKGTYDVVSERVRALLARYTARPVGARVTLTAGVTDVVRIHHHLKHDLGFAEVGFAPVTTADRSVFNLNGAELRQVFDGLKELGRAYLEAALAGGNTGFSNMHQLLTDFTEGTAKALPCGAGIGLLAVASDGDITLCHRFTGSDLPTFGNVNTGWDREAARGFVERAANRNDTGCSTCWIRKLCAGGCYHEAYARHADPLHPNVHYCELMRDWVEFGLSVYAEIKQRNPEFIDRHVAPRRAH